MNDSVLEVENVHLEMYADDSTYAQQQSLWKLKVALLLPMQNQFTAGSVSTWMHVAGYNQKAK